MTGKLAPITPAFLTWAHHIINLMPQAEHPEDLADLAGTLATELNHIIRFSGIDPDTRYCGIGLLADDRYNTEVINQYLRSRKGQHQ